MAQSGNFVSKRIATQLDSLCYDSFSTGPGSLMILQLNGDTINPSDYQYFWFTSTIIWLKKPEFDSIELSYYQLNIKHDRKYSLRSTNIIQDELAISYEEKLYAKDRSSTSTNYSGNDELQKVGSISRGVAFGNNQNLSVNSNLDLQLSGNLTDDYVLSAALSDRNIPIQPEGTTSNIQEFDQVYVNVAGKGTSATIGDFFVASDPENYFLKTYKKTQGVSATQSFNSNDRENVVGLNLGITRGRFARNTFNGEEGNQGPYRLLGENGELFIIVIAGTERVYVNGRQLERGEQNEYIIDYNAGEITFTPKQLVTSNDRIIVEFQYADNSYERSISHAFASSKGENGKWSFNYYSEQDNRNKPFFTTFSAGDVQSLAQAGDKLELAFKLAEDTSGITDNTIRYRKTDTLVDGISYEGIYVQTDNEESGMYRVSFSFVGAGKGDYTEEDILVNGRVYKWTAPENGESTGSYAPIIRLIAPKRTRLITGAYRGKIWQKITVNSELALSNHDINTFSNLDEADDDGLGTKLNLGYGDSILKKSLAINADFVTEYTSQNFNTIERFRSVEFSRTWNRQLSNQGNISDAQSSLWLNGFSFGLGFKGLKASHLVQSLQMDSFFNGFQNLTSVEYDHKYLKISASSERLGSTSNQGQANEFMGNTSAERVVVETPTRFLRAGFQVFNETNNYRFSANDSLLGQSFGSYENNFYIRNHDSSKFEYLVSLGRRSISLPFDNELQTDNKSTDIKTELSLGQSARFNLSFNTTYRIFDKTLDDSLDENTLLNRIEYRARALKGLVQTNSYYQIGTGRERQFEILYLFVGNGLGDFVWADLNENGKQDLGEFRPQEFTGQGDYIRTVVNSNRYVNAISNEFYQTLNFVPATIWSNQIGVKGFFSKFSNQATGSINRKTRDANSIDQLNPFLIDIEQENLISTQAQLRNSVYFNRLSSKFGLEYTWFTVSSKNLFVYGFEGNEKTENLLQMRWNLTSIFSLFPIYSNGTLVSSSESFAQKNYSLDYSQLKLKAQLQSGTSFRVAVNGEIYNGFEPSDSSASVARNLLGVELTYSQALKGAITAKFDYIQVDFEGQKNSPLGFAMLNGLQPGNNITWSLISNYQISRQAQIGINYEGRYSVINGVIQTGSVNARWLF